MVKPQLNHVLWLCIDTLFVMVSSWMQGLPGSKQTVYWEPDYKRLPTCKEKWLPTCKPLASWQQLRATNLESTEVHAVARSFKQDLWIRGALDMQGPLLYTHTQPAFLLRSCLFQDQEAYRLWVRFPCAVGHIGSDRAVVLSGSSVKGREDLSTKWPCCSAILLKALEVTDHCWQHWNNMFVVSSILGVFQRPL